jgi:hypothetical protein
MSGEDGINDFSLGFIAFQGQGVMGQGFGLRKLSLHLHFEIESFAFSALALSSFCLYC